MIMASCVGSFRVMNGSAQRLPFSDKLHHLKLSASTSFKNFPLLRIDESCKTLRQTSLKLLDFVVDQVFHFVDEPLLPSQPSLWIRFSTSLMSHCFHSQRNCAPVEEIGEAVNVSIVEGRVPDDFPEGVYIRNGSNPLFGGLKSAVSVFGKTSNLWIEGEGMLHAVYFKNGNVAVYRNRYVETETFKLEKERNRPCFLPAVEGDPPAVIASFLLNLLRFGIPNEQMSNTNIIEHAGKFYSVAENFVPQEIDITTLETIGDWDIDGAWTRPFTSHPKKAPETGELVTLGADAQKPYCVLGVISADGKKLIHQVDLKFKRSTLIHELGVTKKYNVILDFPLIVDLNRVIRGGPLIKYEEEGYSRIGIMPRYGNADSIQWFEVEASCAFHIINCFEDGDEVVVMGCRARESIIPGPDLGKNKTEWFSRGLKHINLVQENNENGDGDGMLFSRAYEWRLNLKTGEVREGYLTGTLFSMDFPTINADFVGVSNKYAYTQIVDSPASTSSGMAKYGGLAKLHLQERDGSGISNGEEVIKVEYHMFPQNTFCSGSAFVAKSFSADEDDGWIITFVHNEDLDLSQVYIVDAKQFSSEPIAKIALPCRVPYGFHGIFAYNL